MFKSMCRHYEVSYYNIRSGRVETVHQKSYRKFTSFTDFLAKHGLQLKPDDNTIIMPAAILLVRFLWEAEQ